MNWVEGLQGQGHTVSLNRDGAKHCQGHTGGKQQGKTSITTKFILALLCWKYILPVAPAISDYLILSEYF